jgi:hypothetical protein
MTPHHTNYISQDTAGYISSLYKNIRIHDVRQAPDTLDNCFTGLPMDQSSALSNISAAVLIMLSDRPIMDALTFRSGTG